MKHMVISEYLIPASYLSFELFMSSSTCMQLRSPALCNSFQAITGARNGFFASNGLQLIEDLEKGSESEVVDA